VKKVGLAIISLGTVGSPGLALPPLPPGEDIYDLRPWEQIPFPWLEWGLQGVAVVAVFLVGRAVLRWLLRPVARAAPQPVDPVEQALKALDRLLRSPVWQEGRWKDVCEQIALILKECLYRRDHLGTGGSATTDELRQALARIDVEQTWRVAVLDLLNRCDEVKFARGALPADGPETLVSEARRLVRRRVVSA
jgi:hypothetical protein